jgi:hypothetical protein
MAEKDPKKVDDKAGTQTDTVQLTPEMLLLVNAITNAYGTAQRNMVLTPIQTQTTGDGAEQPFTDAAKAAVEKFNDIAAGLQLKPILTPTLDPITRPNGIVTLTWRMPTQLDTLDGFQIQRAEGSSTQFENIGPVLPATSRTSPDTTVTTGKSYRYRVVAHTTNRGEFVSNVQPPEPLPV